jgi:hypothetical protein
MMKKAYILGTLILLSLPLLIYAAQSGQTWNAVSDVLDRQVTVSKDEYPTTHSSFLESLVNARAPGGIVTILNCDNKHPARPTSLSSGTLRETMDTIVKTNPEYRWQIDEGVINLLPTHDEPALLNLRISKLRVKDARSLNSILGNLLELPEVKDLVAKLQLSPGVKFIVGPVSMNPERDPKYTVECENVTVREALNAIVRAHGRAAWEYKEQRCGGKTEYSVDFVIQ